MHAVSSTVSTSPWLVWAMWFGPVWILMRHVDDLAPHAREIPEDALRRAGSLARERYADLRDRP